MDVLTRKHRKTSDQGKKNERNNENIKKLTR